MTECTDYQDVNFWVRKMSREKDFFCKDFTEPAFRGQGLIVNANIVVPRQRIFSSEWLYLPNASALLGFLQYVYCPTIYLATVGVVRDVSCPPLSTESLLAFLRQQRIEEKDRMMEALGLLQVLWEISENELLSHLAGFCNWFSETKPRKTEGSALLLFTQAIDVYAYIHEQIHDEEDFNAEFGCGHDWLRNLCHNFERGYFFRQRLLYFLNKQLGLSSLAI